MLKGIPAVFAVGNEYQIMFYTEGASFVSVRVGDEEYYDASNGILCSLRNIHRVTVPMEALDRAEEYTVLDEPVTDRLPYFPKTEPVEAHVFAFRPVPETGVRLYHIADAHGDIEGPVRAASVYGDVDLLIFNGDILNDSSDPECFWNIYEMAGRITKGTKPVVFSRGNHDLRGLYAEAFKDYTPNRNGYTYYSFRVGSIWGLVLDCGEDKDDSHPEYGHSVRCHPFRLRETEYLKEIVRNAETEYAAPGVKTRLLIVHNPFTWQIGEPFDIEEEIFRTWASILKENVRPDLMICGHMHFYCLDLPDGEHDDLGLPCPCAVASYLKDGVFGGAGFTVTDARIDVKYTLSDGSTAGEYTVTKEIE